MSDLSWNRYGKSRIRLVKVRRARDPHELVDLTIDVQLEGAFEAVYVAGDNRSMPRHRHHEEHRVRAWRGSIRSTTWRHSGRHWPITSSRSRRSRGSGSASSSSRGDACRAAGSRTRTRSSRPAPSIGRRSSRATRAATEMVSGLANLVVLKTTDSAFSGFPRDRIHDAPRHRGSHHGDVDDGGVDLPAGGVRLSRAGAGAPRAGRDIRGAQSRSVQHTLYAMGEAALAACPDLAAITLTLPNRHHLLVDLTPFGLDNPNEIFVATDQPYGLIEATIRRTLG